MKLSLGKRPLRSVLLCQVVVLQLVASTVLADSLPAARAAFAQAISGTETVEPADGVSDATPQNASEEIVVGDSGCSVTLDPKRNYALSEIRVDGRTFESGRRFPTITVYDQTGARSEFVPDDPRWTVHARKCGAGCDVVYGCDGLEVEVTYAVRGEGITVSVRPTTERNYKALLLSGGGSLVTIAGEKPNAMSSAFIVTPTGGGTLVEIPSDAQKAIASPPQSWAYPASFFGFGYEGRGLIARCPQFGGVWSYGTGDVNSRFSLIGDVAVAFRPCSRYFDMVLPEPVIELQFVPVADTNGDGVFDWVDIGVKYRKQFIKRNADMDYALRDSVLGKIDIAAGFGSTQNYRQLIEQIRTIDFAPQTIWLVGAHTPPEGNYVDPPYTDKPDPCHNGPDNYDYFAFKREAEDVGARVGIHELFQDISPRTFDWSAEIPLKCAEDGTPRGTWGGVGWQCYAKALHVMLDDGSFQRSLDKHFKDWDVRPGDTWHWDCLTAFGGREDFSPVHPATNGTDIRRCMEVLKYFKDKRIHITSEGLQEGMAEFCDFAWSAQINLGEPEGGFKKARTVPLTPVLFQGMTYYSLSWHPAYGLLYGGKAAYEATGLDREGAIQGYFGGDVFWQKIADRTVQNMIKTESGWRVEYSQGGTLEVDLANMTPAMTFVLTIDGEKFTPENAPPSPWGVRAEKVDGKYRLIYPEGRNPLKQTCVSPR